MQINKVDKLNLGYMIFGKLKLVDEISQSFNEIHMNLDGGPMWIRMMLM